MFHEMRRSNMQLLREKYRPEYKVTTDQPTTTTQSKTLVYEFRV